MAPTLEGIEYWSNAIWFKDMKTIMYPVVAPVQVY
jgi:hypothetical protein